METGGPGIKNPALLRVWKGPFLGVERRLTFLGTDNEICLAWLAGALQQVRLEGQTKVVGYLEAVLEEVAFEAKMNPPVVIPRTEGV